MLVTGRTPNIEGLGLNDIGVRFNDNGLPDIDRETLKIPGFPIYMSGDVNGIKPLLHEAHDESRMIAARILGDPMPERRTGLQITFTEPNIAHIGLQPGDIEEAFVTGSVSYNDQGRARVMGENEGMLNVYASKKDRTLLGAALVAPAGEHMAHLLALAIHQKIDVKIFLDFPFYHPTVEEGLRKALRQIRHPE